MLEIILSVLGVIVGTGVLMAIFWFVIVSPVQELVRDGRERGRTYNPDCEEHAEQMMAMEDDDE